MTFDAHKNFAYSVVVTPPSPAISGTSLSVASGQGALFPATPFNCTVWPAGVQPLAANAEIVRVTNILTDTFTIVRAQESSSAISIAAGFQIANTETVKVFTDIQNMTIDQWAALNATAADWSNNSHKITSLLAGTSSTDAVNVGQLTPAHADTRFASPIMGTIFSTTLLANEIYLAMVSIPYPTTLTGIIVNCTSATGNLLVSIFNSTGTQLAKSNSTAQVNSPNQFVPFTGTLAVTPGAYLIGIQASSATPTFTQGIFAGHCGGIAQGTFVVPSTVTPPSLTNAIQMPYLSTY